MQSNAFLVTYKKLCFSCLPTPRSFAWLFALSLPSPFTFLFLLSTCILIIGSSLFSSSLSLLLALQVLESAHGCGAAAGSVEVRRNVECGPVSYTHLTLPTICSV
eukprot:TRINITY_DN12534_c0_g1_i5.p1 TRINITY_DN12534_c0_g1~~TRINITY_DN12534_c0_g1_i5.p1  ORF type:complete len:105 (-),score=5.04 TRINITY_DN12534_c0_g1_i5:37-351(-)